MSARDVIKKRHEIWESNHDVEKDRDFRDSVAEYLTSPRGAALREEIGQEPRLLIEMVFVIVDKYKKTVPFFLNDVQRDFSDDLYKAERDFYDGKLLEITFLVLKNRQQGFTAYITAEQLARSIITKNFSGFTIADCADNTSAIFEDKAKYTYNLLPDLLKPTEKYNNRKELHFSELNSRWRIATASKDVGRSKTVNFLHISEAAFLPVLISDIQTAVGEALTKDAIQIFESTANGYNEFKDAWDSGSFINKFYPFWKTAEYRQAFESPEKKEQFVEMVHYKNDWIHERCRWLIEVISLEWEQVYWYYNKWSKYIDKEKIKQEYPCSAEEAFLASGRCVFDKELIIHRIEELKIKYKERPYRTGRFSFEWNDPETKDKIKDDTIKWIDDPAGFIRLYEDAQYGMPYVIGGDTKGEGKDFYAGTAINNVTGNRCASIHMQITNSKPFTWQMYCLGRYFNDALIGVEMNWNTGPIEELERLKYPHQYVRQHYDSIRKEYQKKFGWRTDGNTRPLIIDREISMVEDHIDLFNDIPTLDEMLTFIYDEDNRPDAESGKHDDLLFSDMIGQEIRSQQTTKIQKPKEEKTDIQAYKDKLAKRSSRNRRRLT
jgi:hypothetical protein